MDSYCVGKTSSISELYWLCYNHKAPLATISTKMVKKIAYSYAQDKV